MDFISFITEDLYVVEYKWFDGGWTFRDSYIIDLVEKFRYKNRIFYNVKNFNLWNPLAYFRDPGVRLWVGFYKEQACGAYWLSTYNSLNKSGFFNCAMCKDAFEDEREYITAAHQGLDWLLNRDDINILYGETSVNNKPVLFLADYFGFQTVGIIPQAHYHADEDKWYDTQFMYITKETLRPLEVIKNG